MNSSSTNIATSSSARLNKKQKTSGPNFDEIWSFYQQGPNKGNGHYKATHFYCSTSWEHGKPQTMKAHLANYCSKCPENISSYWQQKLVEKSNNSSNFKELFK
ncbi:27151_t:CDS:1 [Dentiscutata erythropus]|uniref:27151_t:CDS:1 n=1 Tax=Dentiscutata erythropus TaxID=1348616 RepID=A0A9N8VMS1_9GLOM|nr:27151_t:CDS:1 [Dentiscutata erythropus]